MAKEVIDPKKGSNAPGDGGLTSKAQPAHTTTVHVHVHVHVTCACACAHHAARPLVSSAAAQVHLLHGISMALLAFLHER